MWRITLSTLAAHRRRLLATCSAVLLAVAFLSATSVVTRTVRDGFAVLLAEANAGTDALVRSSVEVGREETTERGLVDRSLLDTVAAVDGVAAVAPRIEADGRIAGADGDAIVRGGRTVAGNWVEDERLNPYGLAEGRAPEAPGEVVIDRASAEEGDLAVGDTTVVRTPDPIEVTVVGVATFGDADSRGSDTYAGFTTGFAAETLLPDPGRVSSVAVAGDPGVSQAELVRRLGAALPGGVEAVTGAALTREMELSIQGEDVETFRQALLAFAILALVVATVSISTTFSILVAQRARESALLRALGASRRQVRRAVAAEALAVGLVGSVGGIVAGTGLAHGLLGLMDTLGLATPPATPALDAVTVAVGLAVGVVATLLASLAPAVRASRVPPLAALRDVAVDRSATSRGRVAAGVVLTGPGVALAVAGAAGRVVETALLGALATLVGAVVLGPVVARPAAAVLGAPLARWRGVTGALARANAMRNPRRTAGTATSLMIGVAVVSLFTVVGASLRQSVEDAFDEHLAGDLMVTGEGRGGLSAELAPAVAALPEVATASPLGGAPVRIDGRSSLATTVDPATVGSIVDLDVRDGSLRDLRPDQLAVSVAYADELDLALGDRVTVEYADGAVERPTVGAVYGNANLIASGGLVLPRDAARPHTSRRADVNLLIELADGVTEAEGRAAVQRVADRFDAPDVETGEEVADAIGAEIDVLLTVIYVLLAVAVVIALMGIATTLSLSIHERTRELGLLRAVGQTRRQVRAMVRGEAVIVALLGTVGGLALGVFLGWALVASLTGAGGETAFTTFAVPVTALAVVLVLGALAGVAAAARPARRAARLDVLPAIATD